MEDGLIYSQDSEKSAAAQAELWKFFAHRTALFTMGESSSVSIETARSLLESIRFTLDMALKAQGLPREALADCDIDALFNCGVKEIERTIKTVLRLCARAYATLPPIKNRYLDSTLKSIGTFRERYQHMYFAHEIPCEIDYILCIPVSESCLGTDYLVKYLRRLCAENAILSRFDAKAADALLEKNFPGYASSPLNMCEPLLINSLGLVLLGKAPNGNEITDADRGRLSEILDWQTVGTLEAAIGSAAKKLCTCLGLTDTYTCRYIADAAGLQCSAICSALQANNLGRLFI